MNNDWERVAAVFEAAVLRDPAERVSFVREACADDPELRGELLDDYHPVVLGTQLGPYRVESLLGVGGMGEVYRATDTVLGRQVAIKICRRAWPPIPRGSRGSSASPASSRR